MISESALIASMTLWSRAAASALAPSALASTLSVSGRTGSAGVSARVRDSTATRAASAAARASHRAGRPAVAGGDSAEVPALPGCYTQGETLEEVRANLREAAEGWLAAAHDAATRPADREGAA